jgi:hypothetical protein
LWGPKGAIEAAQVESAATEEQRAKRREHSTRARERHEAAYRDDLEDAIRRFLAFAPEHSDLEHQIAREAATRAAVVGSGRVGRTRTLSLEERASLAARALIRHRYTTYEDDLFDAARDGRWDEESWYREIRTETQTTVDDFLERHRASPG